MKRIKTIFIIIFTVIIISPLITFNFEKGAVSEIDNKVLADNPFSPDFEDNGRSLMENIKSYVTDRLGVRDKLILGYTVLNDKLFKTMEHPIYTYGKDGYIFGSGITVDEEYSQYHEDFADMVLKIQTYCEQRGVPFVFVFEPAKPAVLQEYIADGINYDRQWVDEFMEALNERDINYVDNTVVLREKIEEGEMVFNQKFDANHWNSLGAYYGVNAALENLKEFDDRVHVNSLDEMDYKETKATTLLVSEFPIDEILPNLIPKVEADYSITDKYSEELEINEDYSTFYYYENETRKNEGAPKALVFQGSYMNSYGYPFFANSFSEYIYVHDYQNIMNFDYYYNIFKPEVVVFEVAEYTFSDGYFSQDVMRHMKLNNTYNNACEACSVKETSNIDKDSISVREGETLTKITWNTEDVFDSVWFLMNQEYDMRKCEEGYEVTVLSEDYKDYKEDISIDTLKEGNLVECNFN